MTSAGAETTASLTLPSTSSLDDTITELELFSLEQLLALRPNLVRARP
jgi:hypothetical protein